MSAAVMSPANWQQHATATIEDFAAHQGAVSPNSQEILRLVTSYDSVTFDFSDWTVDQLNENTTSFFWALSPGSLDISCYNLKNGNLTEDVHTASLVVDDDDAHAGKDAVCIHDWCVEQAKAARSFIADQRCFRFEQGRYAGPLPFPGLRVMGKSLGNC
ncbi:hypothetical protein F4778DRAFT_723937 [Xylariomycetidae sp. FL2044]|nr:hypothetical protein F4778DRAFT_723937 [Xylariomycetidae sp. FL2044]